MHTRFALVIAAVAAPFFLLLIGSGRCADSPVSPAASPVEKRLAELENKVAALTKEVETLRDEDDIRLMPVSHYLRMSATEAADAVKVLFRSYPGFEVFPVPEGNLLMLRGNKKVIEEIVGFFQMIEPLGKAKQPLSPEDTKRLRDIESKLSEFTKEIDRLHQDDVFEIVNLNSMSAKDAANAIAAVFLAPLPIHVMAMPGPNLLIVRGDKKVVEKVAEFVKMIEPLGEAKQKAIQDAKDAPKKEPNQ